MLTNTSDIQQGCCRKVSDTMTWTHEIKFMHWNTCNG